LCSHPPNPGAPRRTFHQAAFSVHQNPQRGPGRLTDSAARTDVMLLIRCTVRPRGYASGFDPPAALLGTRRVLARQGWAGEKVAFLSILRECSAVVPHVWILKF